jgi:hypothetical protein
VERVKSKAEVRGCSGTYSRQLIAMMIPGLDPTEIPTTTGCKDLRSVQVIAHTRIGPGLESLDLQVNAHTRIGPGLESLDHTIAQPS